VPWAVDIATIKDTTYFTPNSAAAVAAINGSATQEVLNSILKYHVVGKLVYSNNFTNGTILQTLSGGKIAITVDPDGSTYVNTAKVIGTNYLVYNGVMHIIDKYVSRFCFVLGLTNGLLAFLTLTT
jgi:uncharacterized surface protein with fasciclin (FAS1) repeats